MRHGPRSSHLATGLLGLVLAGGLGACGSGKAAPEARATAASTPAGKTEIARRGRARPHDWPMFGVGPGRTNAYRHRTGITARSVAKLHRTVVRLPGTVDSAPIFLHHVRVGARTRDVVVMTTSYGRTLAFDARTTKRLWEFVPPGIDGWEGTEQITTAAPAADPGRRAVYAASPDGRIHKLALADGREATSGEWPASITTLPRREKIASALGVYGRYVLATTGGYIGDAPPYQGHVVALDRATGALHAVFNSLCSDRHALQDPATCRKSASAIWGRMGAVVDTRAREVYVATGNAAFDGDTNWGDSMLVLSFPDLELRRNWTPYNQQQLTDEDKDLGSVSPVLLPGGLVLQGGKDARMDVLSRAHPNGHDTAPSARLGGELQTLPLPGAAQVLATGAPAVLGKTVFVAADSIAAYRVSGGRLHKRWEHAAGGTTAVVAGGLLYVYDPGGRLNVYRPATGERIASLPAAAGHWNAPIVVGGRVWLPEGDANAHATSGTLSVYSAP